MAQNNEGDQVGYKFRDDISQMSPHERKRRCTDICCTVLFIIFCVGQVFVVLMALTFGEPQVFLYPRDSYGNLCGSDVKVKHLPFLLFFDVVECAKLGIDVFWTGCTTPQVCVEACPSGYWTYQKAELDEKIPGIYLFVSGDTNKFFKILIN